MNIVLHPHQEILKKAIYNKWNEGDKNVLAVLSTGGGKSVIASDIVLDGAMLGMTQAVVAHRNELVSQMSVHIANRGIPHKIIGPAQIIAQITRLHRNQFNGKSFINPSAKTSVVGVDTLMARSEDLKDWASKHDRWVIDECHHVVRENKWGKTVKMFHRAHGLGVTATPLRADGQGLGSEYDGVFDSMVVGLSMRELITLGNLSDYEIVCPESDMRLTDEDIGESGDFTKHKLKSAAMKSHIVGDVVQNYCRWGFGKQAICFATDVETAGNIAKQFNDNGIRAVSLSAKTPLAVREKYLNEFKKGKLWILVNVDLFDEGFDCPGASTVIMARPTASLGKYMQMVGRALRVAPGKSHALIIDHVSNIIRHKLPDKHREWSLARRDKKAKKEKDPEDVELTVCRLCSKPYEKFHKMCPFCGEQPPLPDPRERTIDMVDGDLILLDREALEKIRKNTVLESVADIGERVGKAAGDIPARGIMNKQREKIMAQKRLSDAIAQWAAIQRQNGRGDSESYRRFYLTIGEDVLSSLSVDKTRQEYESLAERIEGWYS